MMNSQKSTVNCTRPVLSIGHESKGSRLRLPMAVRKGSSSSTTNTTLSFSELLSDELLDRSPASWLLFVPASALDGSSHSRTRCLLARLELFVTGSVALTSWRRRF